MSEAPGLLIEMSDVSIHVAQGPRRSSILVHSACRMRSWSGSPRSSSPMRATRAASSARPSARRRHWCTCANTPPGEDRCQVQDQRVHSPRLHQRSHPPARRTDATSAEDPAQGRCGLRPAGRHPPDATLAECHRVGDGPAHYSAKHRRHRATVHLVTDPGGATAVALTTPTRPGSTT
jgi:hypothetical protein